MPAASRGYDGGKKINGRHRYVITDSLGLLLMVLVCAADVTDRQAARGMLPHLRTRFAKITLVWANGGYSGRLVTWAKEKLQLTLDHGWLEPTRLRRTLVGLPLPKAADGRIVLAVDVSNWLRPDAPTSDDRLFCHVYGRGDRKTDQLVPGWPYSFVAALESGRTSWVALLDAVRLGPADDATLVTATQLRDVVERLTQAGHWRPGDQEILIVMDAGYDVTYLPTPWPTCR